MQVGAGTREISQWNRAFSSAVRLRDEKDKTNQPASSIDPPKLNESTDPIEPTKTLEPSSTAESPDSTEPNSPTIALPSPSEPPPDTPASVSSSLPSHTEQQRWDYSKKMAKLMDDLLARASVASQHINAYTGTDFSGIEALRKEIVDQEQKVKRYRIAVDESKASHHEAHANQTSAQREIVGLLERKSSWSPTDLERYMSLVRSEHLNERDVQIAKDNLASAERNLEDARSLMERLERKQYHEEQIWSDTIRRNSTWVTFGLMGVNILLLLTQIAIFEPNRRKKIVRDVKAALDEKTLAMAPGVVVEKQMEAVTPKEAVVLEEVQAEPSQPLQPSQPSQPPESSQPSEPSQPLEDLLPPKEEFLPPTPSPPFGEATSAEPGDVAEVMQVVNDVPATMTPVESTVRGTLEEYQEILRDLFSERIVQVKKVDVTNAALQGAASGVALMGLLFLLLRPK
ncbi:uncharacterized protein RCC_10725 [Ramularia collo-cygni]|uniref:Sensitive to high expression protein 9, mitochondrial n=1 Tax=Ramularia collo-cygni TaxID=112498 RepID=A0A2D3V3Y0_9PEZI|nr:uncharacterized protein RCC_10725 [Ramularia collo-cygni]CZT24997.1 uncharacterized protein RCC_10725 [Ramularia collo-cygni]